MEEKLNIIIKASPCSKNFHVLYEGNIIYFKFIGIHPKFKIFNLWLVPITIPLFSICSAIVWVAIFFNHSINLIGLSIFLIFQIYLIILPKFLKKKLKRIQDEDHVYHEFIIDKNLKVKDNEKNLTDLLQKKNNEYIEYYSKEELMYEINNYISLIILIIMIIYFGYLESFNIQ
ncbi:MAG: hypothetical protein ACXIUD_17865 [Mongoliitalea sp.]